MTGSVEMNGKHINMFLVNGIADELTTVEITGWTGHILTGPRSDFGEILKRPELSRSGAYILLTNDEEKAESEVYIGRTHNLGMRLKQHQAKKMFWDRLICISTKGDENIESRWDYLEARLVEEATKANRCSLVNSQYPKIPSVSEACESDLEAFLEHVKIILPVLGVNILRYREQSMPLDNDRLDRPIDGSPIFEYVFGNSKLFARAQVSNGEFFLLKDSDIAPDIDRGERKYEKPTQDAYDRIQRNREKHKELGNIEIGDSKGRVLCDIALTPSAALGLVTNMNLNGRTQWKWTDEHGVTRTFAEWEERGVALDGTVNLPEE
ncbi:MAG: GIY-YIG nuclease family protein [Corynebacterium sp.]|uniref:GIY-YIG nuclease family protein n=1 Tax=Corynebacterium sp. TaxID=1720 RepID=UPI0026DCA9BF|nr:GIY-YIG nuclease family protein [Corynebacterium sp.]MDO5099801.1 GIY-YIG nuclease family protein [Corynebacterium sp.]